VPAVVSFVPCSCASAVCLIVYTELLYTLHYTISRHMFEISIKATGSTVRFKQLLLVVILCCLRVLVQLTDRSCIIIKQLHHLFCYYTTNTFWITATVLKGSTYFACCATACCVMTTVTITSVTLLWHSHVTDWC
jgi:hypothetical protein